jgi:DNA-binding SARP family transcriptional activator
MYTTGDRRTAQLPVMVLNSGVLGPLQMTASGAPLPIGTPKQRAVLAMLVMGRNRPVSSESLVNAAWEQFPPPEPKASLHSYISNLRRLVAGAGLDAKAEWRGPMLDDLRDFEFVDSFATALVEDKLVAHTAHAEAESPAAVAMPSSGRWRAWSASTRTGNHCGCS